MHCTNCGYMTNDQAKFCCNCGKQLILEDKDIIIEDIVAMDDGGAKKTKTFNYAGFWLRVAAYVLDFIIILVGFVIIYLFLYPFFYSFFQVGELFSIVVVWLYYAYFESSEWQATLGKKACNLKVVDYDGKRISFGRATGRYFAKFLSGLTFLIGYIMAGLTTRKQTLHDMIAEVFVIRE